MRALRIVLPIFLVAVLLAGCSSVFTSTITGTVQEEDGSTFVGVENVDVYAFLNQGERDSAVSSNTQPVTTVSIFHGITNADGDFSIPIEWQTTSPTFGKTADRRTVYLAYYSKDFGGMTAASSVSYLSSERTNAMETETLVRTRQTYTLTPVIKNYSQSNANVSPTNFTVIVKDSDSKVLYSGTPTGDTVTFSATVAGVKGTLAITPNNKKGYQQCDVSGNASSVAAAFDFVDSQSVVHTAAETDTLYVKNVETTYTVTMDIQNYSSDFAAVTASNFLVQAYQNSDKSGIRYYSGTPTENSISFSATNGGVSGYVFITPNDSESYSQCDINGTAASTSAAFAITGDLTSTTASTLYVKNVKTTYTLNLEALNVSSSTKTIVSATNFTLKVTDNAGSTIYYQGTPTSNSLTFSTADDVTASPLKVTFTPADSRYYRQSDGTGQSMTASTAVYATYSAGSTTALATCWMKSLLMPALTINGTYGDGTAITLNGLTVNLKDATSTVLATTTTAATQYSANDRVNGTFAFTLDETAITDDSYVNGASKQYSVTYTAEVGSKTKTVSFSNNPNDATTKSVAVSST